MWILIGLMTIDLEQWIVVCLIFFKQTTCQRSVILPFSSGCGHGKQLSCLVIRAMLVLVTRPHTKLYFLTLASILVSSAIDVFNIAG